MAKKYLPTEVPEELLILGWGPEDGDGVVQSKIENLDTHMTFDPTDEAEMEAISDFDNGHLVFKYKLVSVGAVQNTASIKWKTKKL